MSKAKNYSKKNKGKAITEEEMNDVSNWFENEHRLSIEAVESAREALEKKEDNVRALEELSPVKRYKKCESKIRAALLRPSKFQHLLVITGDDLRAGYEENLRPPRMNRIIEYYQKVMHKFKNAVEEARASVVNYPLIAEKLGGFVDLSDSVPEMVRHLPSGEVDTSVVVVLTSDGEFTLPVREGYASASSLSASEEASGGEKKKK